MVCDPVDALCVWKQAQQRRLARMQCDDDDDDDCEASGVDDQDDDAAILEHHNNFAYFTARRNHIPVNLAHGNTKLHHKVAALYWAWSLESNDFEAMVAY